MNERAPRPGSAGSERYEALMRRALDLAERGRGTTSPNPMVGAIVLQGDEIAGEGFHVRAGGPHAEIIALENAGGKARGGTLVVTLEPCCHFGRTPPCVDAILKAGIREVVIGTLDPNPLVSGRGIERLREAGLKVSAGILETDIARQNEAFFHYIQTKRPFVTLKVASTLDGKISFRTGARTQLTSLGAAEYVHRLRAESDAILVGIGTVLVDDPLLTVRTGEKANHKIAGSDEAGRKPPIRIVLDSQGRLPLHSRLVKTVAQAPVLLATTEHADPAHLAKLKNGGVETLVLPSGNASGNASSGEERVELTALLDALGKREVVNLLVEGGSRVNASFVGERLVDKYRFLLAPYLHKGSGAPGMLAPEGLLSPASGMPDIERLVLTGVQLIGPDLAVEAYPLRDQAEENNVSMDKRPQLAGRS